MPNLAESFVEGFKNMWFSLYTLAKPYIPLFVIFIVLYIISDKISYAIVGLLYKFDAINTKWQGAENRASFSTLRTHYANFKQENQAAI